MFCIVWRSLHFRVVYAGTAPIITLQIGRILPPSAREERERETGGHILPMQGVMSKAVSTT